MIIKQLTLEAFGHFKQKTFDLTEGITIIEGLNESGKTTIHAFIEGMFYGFFKPGTTRKTYLDAWEKFKPKKGSAYQGSMIVTHENSTYRIERDFRKRGGYLKLFNEQTGQELTDRFDVNATTKQVDLGVLFDMPYGLYTNTLSVSESDRALNSQAEDDLIRRLQNLNRSGLEAVSTEDAIKHIDRTLKEEIGSEQARTKPYALTQAKLEALETEKAEAHAHHESMLRLKEQLDDTEQHHQALQEEKNALKHTLALHKNTLKKRTLNQMVEAVKSLNVYNHTQGIEALQAFLDEVKQHKNTLNKVEPVYQKITDLNKENAMLERHVKDETNTISDRAYHEMTADKARHDTLKTHLKSEAIKSKEQTITTINGQLKATTEKHAHIKRLRTTWSLTLSALVLLVTTGLFWWFNDAEVLYVLGGLIVPMSVWVLTTKRIKTLAHETGKLKESYDTLTHEIDKDQKSHEEAKRALERLYAKHNCVDEDDFIQTYYQAQTKHENTARLHRWQTNMATNKAAKEEAVTSLDSLFKAFNLSPKAEHVKTLRDIQTAFETCQRLLDGQPFASFYEQVDDALPEVDTVNIASLQADLETVNQKLTSTLETLSSQEATFKEKLSLTRDMSLIEYDIAETGKTLQDLVTSRHVLETAKAMIDEAADQIEENFAPVLSRHIAEILPAITREKYHDLKVRRNLDFKLYVPATASLESTPFFSKGTLEQIYVAIRLGILQALEKTDVPLILDDAFVHFDDERLASALKLLTTHSTPQCLIFTCQTREKAWVDQEQIPHTYIQL